MKNYEYEKVFSDENDREKGPYPDTAEAEKIKNFIKRYEKALVHCQYYVPPFAPVLFEKTIRDCEQIAKEFSGRIKATINYSVFSATIELWCCYVEFRHDEFMHILQEISRCAVIVRFVPTLSNDLHIKIEMPYFILINQPHEFD